MKERQRWQPEEDALLLSYVKQYGPKEWNLISHRMPTPLHRDPKSCLERYKNYLKPGIKKGSLTPDEQALVISLQAKYGNKWKKIATQVPGRTAKRLGKWWEVFRDKQLKKNNTHKEYSGCTSENISACGSGSSPEEELKGRYDHILETFAEKYVQPKLVTLQSFPSVLLPNLALREPVPILSLAVSETGLPVCPNATGSGSCSSTLPPWMSGSNSTTSSSSCSTTPSPSVSLTLSPSEPDSVQTKLTRFMPVQQMGTVIQYCKELEEGRQNWVQQKKEATWRLSRLEQQLESEKARKRREKMEEVEAKIRCLREEEMAYGSRIESECREQLSAIQREAESKEAKLMEAWCSKHVQLAKLVQQLSSPHSFNVTN